MNVLEFNIEVLKNIKVKIVKEKKIKAGFKTQVKSCRAVAGIVQS